MASWIAGGRPDLDDPLGWEADVTWEFVHGQWNFISQLDQEEPADEFRLREKSVD